MTYDKQAFIVHYKWIRTYIGAVQAVVGAVKTLWLRFIKREGTFAVHCIYWKRQADQIRNHHPWKTSSNKSKRNAVWLWTAMFFYFKANHCHIFLPGSTIAQMEFFLSNSSLFFFCLILFLPLSQWLSSTGDQEERDSPRSSNDVRLCPASLLQRCRLQPDRL